ncbi:MAG: hypothetical protein ACK46X_03840 [Candidatus Sericytochromatia bacterium]
MHAPKLLLALVAALSLGACKLPQLPELPKLPKLPTVAQMLPVGSSGQSLKDALAQAAPLAEAWAPGATWMRLTGVKLDPGGRNGGHKEGVWIFLFRSESKPAALEVRVSQGQAVQRDIENMTFSEAALPADMAGLLDSTDAATKAGIDSRSLTIVLRQDAAGPLYNLVEEGGTRRATIDAKTGEKKE